jgi:membrane protease subunit HflC
MKKKSMLMVGVFIFILLILRLCVFRVSANETAVTTLFGKVLYEVNAQAPDSSVAQEKSGIFFKVPFFQLVKKYDLRVYVKEIVKKDRLTEDEKNINISIALGWKIASPKKFFESSDNLFDVDNKLEQVIDGSLGQIVGKLKLDSFFGSLETNGLKELEKAFNNNNLDLQKSIERYGVEIVFAKVTHIGFPPTVLPTILDRMKAERSKESAVYIAQGLKEAKIIVTEAESKKEKELADARSKAKVARSEALGKLTEYYQVLSEAPELSSYLRKLDSLKKTFEGKGQKRLILDPSTFLNEFEKNLGEAKP